MTAKAKWDMRVGVSSSRGKKSELRGMEAKWALSIFFSKISLLSLEPENRGVGCGVVCGGKLRRMGRSFFLSLSLFAAAALVSTRTCKHNNPERKRRGGELGKCRPTDTPDAQSQISF